MIARKLYRHPLSGHAHRAQLMLSLLGLDVSLVDVDLANGAHKQSDFLTKNPFGQVPVLEDDGHTLADSNAILVYLVQRYDSSGRWLPEDPATQAEIQRFLSVAAGQLANGPAAARLVNVFGAALDHGRAKAISQDLLAIFEALLSQHPWLVGQHPTIADVANYSYIAHAPEGDVDLTPYPNVRQWLARLEALPGFVPMQPTAVGLVSIP